MGFFGSTSCVQGSLSKTVVVLLMVQTLRQGGVQHREAGLGVGGPAQEEGSGQMEGSRADVKACQRARPPWHWAEAGTAQVCWGMDRGLCSPKLGAERRWGSFLREY